MSEHLAGLPPGFDSLSIEQQIDYVQALWERIAERAKDLPVPEAHLRVIEQRLEEHRRNPEDVVSWDDARKAVEESLRKSRE